MNNGRLPGDLNLTELFERLPAAPPSHDDQEFESTQPDICVTEPTAMEVFFAWERLRIGFNLVLALVVAWGTSGPRGVAHALSLNEVLIGLLIVNAVFSIGPVAEGYQCWFGVPRGLARWLSLLGASTGGSVALLTMWLMR